MNFFRSVFSDEPDPPNSEPESESESESLKHEEADPDSPPKESVSDPNPSASAWNFGSLIKTLATSSESMIETYRRDLQEFSTGLKKEIEVAQGSLGTVGVTIDEFGHSVLRGTAEMIAQGKDAILAADAESDSSSDAVNPRRSMDKPRYSRFEAQVRLVQGDINTYSDEPEDLEDYNKWRLGFDLEGKGEEIDGLLEENVEMKTIYRRIAPGSVDHDSFWCRYFYKVFKLKQAENLRANLVKRAISRDEDEELTWDVDDEEEDVEFEKNVVPKASSKKQEDIGSKNSEEVVKEEAAKEVSKGDCEQIEIENAKNVVEEPQLASSAVVKEEGDTMLAVNNEDKGSVDEKKGVADKEDSVAKSDEKAPLEGKADKTESTNGKDSDISVVSSQPSMPEEEEDLGWDDIEDLSCIDDKKATTGGSSSPKRSAELRKRLSTADEEDEDLSWDIEDDDEPAKA